MLSKENRIDTKEKLNDWLKYELSQYGNANALAFLGIREVDILRRHQSLLRKSEYYFNTGKKLLYVITRAKLRVLQNKYCLHIPLNCCGRGLRIMHTGPILMNNRVTVGEDCRFHINTALVAGGTNDDVPTLGNGVVMGIGAVALGGIYIADYIAVGANAVVNKSFTDENITIAGVPAKKVSDHGSKSWGRNRINSETE